MVLIGIRFYNHWKGRVVKAMVRQNKSFEEEELCQRFTGRYNWKSFRFWSQIVNSFSFYTCTCNDVRLIWMGDHPAFSLVDMLQFDFKGEFLCADDLCVWYLEWFVEYWMKNVWVCRIYMYRCRIYFIEELLTCIYLPFFFHEKICLPFVYHRCVLQIILLSLCVNLLCCKVCYSKKRAKGAGSIFYCKGLHSIQTIVCFHFFDPIDFFSFIGMVS